MNSRQISCFLEAARCGSFTTAAKRLYISQPTFSRNISQLEKELDLTLFSRNSFNGVNLTKSGEIMAEALERTQADLDAAVERAHDIERQRLVHLTLGLLEGQLLDDSLSKTISMARISHPNLRVHILRDTYQTLMEALSAGKVDVVCMPDWQLGDTSRLQVVPHSEIETVLAAPRRLVGTPEQRAYSIAEFSALPFVSLAETECVPVTDMLRNLFARAGINPPVILADSLEEQIQKVEMGEGAILINPYNYICYSPNVSCFAVAELEPQPFSLAWAKDGRSESLTLLRSLLPDRDKMRR